MKITESRLRSIIRSVIKESTGSRPEAYAGMGGGVSKDLQDPDLVLKAETCMVLPDHRLEGMCKEIYMCNPELELWCSELPKQIESGNKRGLLDCLYHICQDKKCCEIVKNYCNIRKFKFSGFEITSEISNLDGGNYRYMLRIKVSPNDDITRGLIDSLCRTKFKLERLVMSTQELLFGHNNIRDLNDCLNYLRSYMISRDNFPVLSDEKDIMENFEEILDQLGDEIKNKIARRIKQNRGPAGARGKFLEILKRAYRSSYDIEIGDEELGKAINNALYSYMERKIGR